LLPPLNLISPLKPKLKLNSNKSWEKSPPPSKTSLLPKTKLNPPKNKKKLPLLYKKKDLLKTPNVSSILKIRNKKKSNNVLLGELNTKPTKSTELLKSKSSKPLKTSSLPN
jgi:hypothetical protein